MTPTAELLGLMALLDEVAYESDVRPILAKRLPNGRADPKMAGLRIERGAAGAGVGASPSRRQARMRLLTSTLYLRAVARMRMTTESRMKRRLWRMQGTVA